MFRLASCHQNLSQLFIQNSFNKMLRKITQWVSRLISNKAKDFSLMPLKYNCADVGGAATCIRSTYIRTFIVVRLSGWRSNIVAQRWGKYSLTICHRTIESKNLMQENTWRSKKVMREEISFDVVITCYCICTYIISATENSSLSFDQQWLTIQKVVFFSTFLFKIMNR